MQKKTIKFWNQQSRWVNSVQTFRWTNKERMMAESRLTQTRNCNIVELPLVAWRDGGNDVIVSHILRKSNADYARIDSAGARGFSTFCGTDTGIGITRNAFIRWWESIRLISATYAVADAISSLCSSRSKRSYFTLNTVGETFRKKRIFIETVCELTYCGIDCLVKNLFILCKFRRSEAAVEKLLRKFSRFIMSSDPLDNIL